MRQLLLIGLLVSAFALAYKNFSDQLRYSVKSIKLKSVSLSGINFDVIVELINPTPKEVTVNSIVFDIIYKTSVLATGQQLTPLLIKANGKTDLTINAKSSFISLTQGLLDALQLFIKQQVKPVVSIAGKINLDQGSLNINATQQIG